MITVRLKLKSRKYNLMNNTFITQLLRLFVSRSSDMDDNQVPISRTGYNDYNHFNARYRKRSLDYR